MQPARMVWPIEIRPFDESPSGEGEAPVRKGKFGAGGVGQEEGSADSASKSWRDPAFIAPPPPDMNYHFPVRGGRDGNLPLKP